MAAPSPEVRAVAWRIRLDVAAAQVTAALAEHGVRSILIKGPSVAKWLYGDRPRNYGDVDLLMSPEAVPKAGPVLAGLGFTTPFEGAGQPGLEEYSAMWRRGRETIDLHTTFTGFGVDGAAAWAVLSARTERQRIGGADLEVLDPPGRAVLVALHAAHHGPGEPHPLADLRRAIALLPPDLWDAAAMLAGRLDAAAAMGVGLRLLPEGEALAHRLGLPPDAPIDIVLQSLGSPPVSRQLAFLLEADGLAAKARILGRQLFPTPAFLRLWRPIARRGRTGLAVAYLWRLGRAARYAPSAIATIVRARAPR